MGLKAYLFPLHSVIFLGRKAKKVKLNFETPLEEIKADTKRVLKLTFS